MSKFPASHVSESAGPSGAQAERIWSEKKVVTPCSWIHQDDLAERITLQVKLTGCIKDDIKVKVWNKRQLIIHAIGQFHRYKLQYKIPPGARLLSRPTFSSQTELLTCRFNALNPVCATCHTSSPRHPIATKEELASVFNGPCFEFVPPSHSIIYDGNKALLEAYLEGCKNYSQIKVHIANNKVYILAHLSSQHYYFLALRLESSAGCEWEAHFDPKMETLTCEIPLLGHYECGRCMAKRQHTAEVTSLEKVEESSHGYPRHVNGPEIQQSPCNTTATCHRQNFNVSLHFHNVTGRNESHLKSFTYSETAV